MREQTTAAEDSRFTFSEDFPVVAPEFFNFGYDVIDKLAKQSRNKLAMVWVNQQGQEKRYTFHDLAQLSNQAANLLIKCGVSRGDRIFLLLPRIPEWWIFSLAMIKIGAIQCPSPVLLTPHDIRERVQFGKFRMIITDSCNAPKVEEIWNECPSLEKRLIVDTERDGWISYPKELQCATTLSRHKVKNAFIARTGAKDPMLMIFTSGTSRNWFCIPMTIRWDTALPLLCGTASVQMICISRFPIPDGRKISGAIISDNGSRGHVFLCMTSAANSMRKNCLPFWKNMKSLRSAHRRPFTA